MMKRLDKYIFMEMVPPFLVSILVFSTVLILGKMTLLTKLIVSRGVSVTDILWLVAAILPSFLVFIVPMATLMAVLLAFHRLSADNEITAMKTAGVSLYHMMRPVALLAVLSYAVTMFLCIHALPWGIWSSKQTIQKIVKAHADVVLKEGIFNDVAGKAVVYMGKYTPKNKYMEEIVISDERDPRVRNTIVAEKGHIVPSSDGKSISFRLMDGVISRVEGGFDSAQTVSFRRYDLNLPLEDFWDLSKVGRRDTEALDPFEMTMGQLNEVIRNGELGTERHQMALLEYHHRFALPVACLVMSLLGVSLGVQFSGGRKSWGMVIALAIFFVYFILYSATKSLGESGLVPVAPGAWAPNVLFGTLGVYLFLQTARETRFDWVERLLHLWKRLLENKRFSGFLSS